MSTATATMRSAVIRRGGRVEMVDVALPEPGPREIRVALEGCGMCGSDLPVWEGRSWFEYPREPGAPGHEGWGRVDAAGEEVTAPAVGDRVAILGYRSYADYDVVPADRAVVLPSQLDDQPFPGEPLACAVNAFERAGVAAGDTVAVVGVGFLGGLLVALAVSVGARVIAISRRPTARDAARRMGAQDQFTLDDSILPRVEAMTAGAGCDVVIEAAGAQASLDLCGPLTRERGRLVIAGFHQDGPRQVDMQLWNWRGLDVVNAHERDPEVYIRGLRRAAQLVADGAIDPRPLYSHEVRLGRLGEAFRDDARPPPGLSQGPRDPVSLVTSEPASPTAGDVRRPRIGFLGVGWIGRSRMQSLAAGGQVEVVGAADPDPAARAAVAATLAQVEVVADLQSLLALKLDGIVIATPSALHAGQAITALRQGVAVYCQKPLARTATETAQRRARPPVKPTGCSAWTSAIATPMPPPRFATSSPAERWAACTPSSSCSTTPTVPTNRGSLNAVCRAGVVSSISAPTSSTSPCG